MTETSLIPRLLGWLSAGYPAGIPQSDYLPLLEVLRRTLTFEEVGSVAAELAGRAAHGVRIDEDDVRAMIAGRGAPEAASPQDVGRVSARLAGGGWPLAGLSTPDERAASRSGVLSRIVGWLREGYPAGVPEQDYIPLLALLQRRLTDEEVRQVATSLRRAEVSPAGPDDIAAAIERLIESTPSDADLHRVKDRLATRGWPVDFPDPDAVVGPHLVRS